MSRFDSEMVSFWRGGVSFEFGTIGGAFGVITRLALPFRLDDESWNMNSSSERRNMPFHHEVESGVSRF